MHLFMSFRLTTEQVNQAMHQMAVQRHLGEKQDEEFHRDPTKKAKLRKKSKQKIYLRVRMYYYYL